MAPLHLLVLPQPGAHVVQDWPVLQHKSCLYARHLSGVAVYQVETIREHIRAFKQDNGVDKVVILWTANTERYAQVSYFEPGGGGSKPSSLICSMALAAPTMHGANMTPISESSK